MKKFALLGAVAALATAGGVFAAWTFTDGSSLSKTEEITVGKNFDDKVNYQGVGTFERTSPSSFNLTVTGVPGANPNQNTFTATLSGTVGYTYTAPAGNTNGTYGCTLVITAPEKVIESGDNTITIPAVNESFELTSGTEEVITVAELWKTTIVCDGTVTEYSEYTALKTAVENFTYTLSVKATESYTAAA